jgi:hypothetical protein
LENNTGSAVTNALVTSGICYVMPLETTGKRLAIALEEENVHHPKKAFHFY